MLFIVDFREILTVDSTAWALSIQIVAKACLWVPKMADTVC